MREISSAVDIKAADDRKTKLPMIIEKHAETCGRNLAKFP
jgi:hypothetical protein